MGLGAYFRLARAGFVLARVYFVRRVPQILVHDLTQKLGEKSAFRSVITVGPAALPFEATRFRSAAPAGARELPPWCARCLP